MQEKDELDLRALEVILSFKEDSKFDKNSALEINKLKKDVIKAFDYLSQNEKEVLVLRFIKGYDVQEIARELKKKDEEVLNILQEASFNVRKILQKGLPVEEKKEAKKTGTLGEKDILNQVVGRDHPIVVFFASLFYIVFIGAIIVISYFILQRFIFSSMPTISEIVDQTKVVVQEQTSKTIVSKTDTQPRNLRIAGSTSLLSLSRRWENAFSIDYPKYHLSLIESDSEKGIQDLIKGKIDIANSSRPVSFLDRQAASAHGIELEEYRVAIDALVIVVNKNNPIGEISLEDLAAIYLGKVSNWTSLASYNKPIYVIAREKGSGTNQFIQNRILGGNELSSMVNRVTSNNEIMKLISQNEGAITCLNSGNYRWDNENIKYLKIKSYENSLAISPFIGNKLNEDAIRYGDYPLAHYLYLISKADPLPKVRDFIDWVLGPQGQKIAEYAGLIPVQEG